MCAYLSTDQGAQLYMQIYLNGDTRKHVLERHDQIELLHILLIPPGPLLLITILKDLILLFHCVVSTFITYFTYPDPV